MKLRCVISSLALSALPGGRAASAEVNVAGSHAESFDSIGNFSFLVSTPGGPPLAVRENRVGGLHGSMDLQAALSTPRIDELVDPRGWQRVCQHRRERESSVAFSPPRSWR